MLIWLILTSEFGVLTMGYIFGWIAGRRQTFKDAKVQNLSDLK